MAELTLKVKAEYESAVACREELRKVEQQMKQLNENSTPQEIERLTKRYAELTAKWENSMSFIGKTAVFFKEAFQSIGKAVKNSADETKSLGTSTKTVLENAEKHLKLEENIADALKKQREEADKRRNTAAEGFNRNKSKLEYNENLFKQKYGGQAEGFYDEKDQEILRKGREAVANWSKEWEDCNTKVQVFDELIALSNERTEKLNEAVSKVKNTYTGFADTAESTATKIFISEDVFRRYDELSSTINGLKKEITDLGNSDDIDIPTLEGKQRELQEAQEEFRAIDEAARNLAEVLGADLAEKVSTALSRLYNLNAEVRKTSDEFNDLKEKLKNAKQELADAKDPTAITKAKAEVDKLTVALDEASIRDVRLFSGGLVQGQKLQDYVNEQVANRPAEKLKKPFAAVATQLETGERAIFVRGNVGQAVRASSSIPGVFEPVKIGSHNFVDGGVVSPVPVDAARQLGAEFVIAVDISSKASGKTPVGMLGIVNQSIAIMGQRLGEQELARADIIIRPRVLDIGAADFSQRGTAILEGEKAAMAAMPQIRAKIEQIQRARAAALLPPAAPKPKCEAPSRLGRMLGRDPKCEG